MLLCRPDVCQRTAGLPFASRPHNRLSPQPRHDSISQIDFEPGVRSGAITKEFWAFTQRRVNHHLSNDHTPVVNTALRREGDGLHAQTEAAGTHRHHSGFCLRRVKTISCPSSELIIHKNQQGQHVRCEEPLGSHWPQSLLTDAPHTLVSFNRFPQLSALKHNAVTGCIDAQRY